MNNTVPSEAGVSYDLLYMNAGDKIIMFAYAIRNLKNILLLGRKLGDASCMIVEL